MKIEILMATYNGELFIGTQIFSLLAQSFQDWRLIIHDDGSKDNTLKIVREFTLTDSRITIIEDGIKCGGAAQNFLHLLQFSTADYIMFCDQDDIWFDNKIELQLEAIKKRNNRIPQVVYSNSYVWIANEGIKGLATLTFPKNTNQFLFLNSGMQGCVAIFNKAMRDVMVSYNGRLAMHDHILHLSGLCLGEVEYIPACLMLYRNHENNVTGATSTSSTNIRQIVKNSALPVVDKKHYEAVLDFYTIFKSKIKAEDKLNIEAYLKMVDTNVVNRLFTIIKSDFQLFNSRFRLIVKLLLRPYINN